jgi:acyl transferase domain-containing protein/acyl-CoA synthetase (AMP-forming)/AMP-acid ligase II/acyl carrier protein
MRDEPSHLIDLVRSQSSRFGGRSLYRVLPDDDGDALQLSFSDLEQQARSIGAFLQKRLPPGERVLIPAPVDLETIAAFFGCVFAGMVAVPVPPPRPFRPCPRTRAIIKDAAPALVLAPEAIVARSGERYAQIPELHGLPWVNVAEAAAGPSQGWTDPRPGPNTVAFLQYTSGSTAVPKGVMVSHGNLLTNCGLIQEAFGSKVGARGVIWLPFYHDMGLIGGVLETLLTGGTSVFFSPAALLKRPFRWLKTISETRAEISGGPAFAFDLCTRKITAAEKAQLDLSSWEVAFIGAEAVHASTIDQFSAAFAPCGFQREAFFPCYGLAEGTLMSSGGHKLRPLSFLPVSAAALNTRRVELAMGPPDKARTLVGCGQNLPGQKIVIVDPDTQTACPDDRVGEIWLSGPSVALGYWNNVEATRDAFQARLRDTGAGPYLRTGDLGFLRDGELYIVGRLKDLIIIRGRNYYPTDIEQSVEAAHPLIRPVSTAAFSIEENDCEQLVIAAEVERRYSEADADNVVVAVRQAVGEHHDVEVSAVVLLKAGALPRTSSGKLQRGEARAAYLANELATLTCWKSIAEPEPHAEGELAADTLAGEPPTAAEIEAWLLDRIATRMGVPRSSLDVAAPLVSLGLSSKEAVLLAARLQEWLRRPIPATLIYNYPTIEAVANFLAGADVCSGAASAGTRNMRFLSRLSERELDAYIRQEIERLRALQTAEKALAGDGDGASVSQAEVALALTEARERLEAVHRAQTEPIAIVGMGCRFPGGVVNPEQFWRLLIEGTDAVGEVPSYRWNVDDYYDPEPGVMAKSYTRWGGFIEGVDQFDPEFFGVSPREAAFIDPQQRLLLEVAWEAFEDAGLPPSRLAGTNTGVYVGAISVDWAYLVGRDLANINGHVGVGGAHSILSNRISYLLDLHGPSLTLDSACSSSLVTVHLACRALRRRDCNVALAGGVNLILTPEMTIALSHARMMSPTGRCKAFDASADGYVRGEGCGLIVLKRLSEAVAAGDRVLGIIRGTAVNQDGRTNGLVAPSGRAQEACIRAALAEASLRPRQISYVEAHGTGTALGDPIEVQALVAALGTERDAERPLLVGSVKTNIGHLESAAGIAGLMKTVLALQHGVIPPHLHLKKLNKLLGVEGTAIAFPVQPSPLPPADEPVYAGVSSFGFGGTNSHVVLEGPPAKPPVLADRVDRPRHVLTLSARSPEALKLLAQRFADRLGAEPAPDLADVAWSANTGRTHFPYRLAVSATTAAEASGLLRAFVEGKEGPGLFTGEAHGKTAPAVAFLMTGQGSQYAGMGRGLYEALPVFRDALDRCDAWLRPYLDMPLLDVIYPKEGVTSPIDETRYTQPALFALEYALVEVWRSWGVEPAAVLGHSVGEYAAACAAGVLAPKDGAWLVSERARLMQALPTGGVMAAVMAPEERVRQALEAVGPGVSVAAVNGPANIVVSGPRELVEQVTALLAAEGVRSQRLVTSHAFHSSLLEPMLGDLERAAASVTFAEKRLEIISNLTGQPVANGLLGEPAYWRRHAREPVQFAQSMQCLADRGHELFLEIGPHPTLLGMARRCLTNHDAQWLPSLRRNVDDWQALLESLAMLYVRGVNVDWTAFDRGYVRRRVSLPTYPFQRQSYWVGKVGAMPQVMINGVWPQQPIASGPASGLLLHPLLGRRIVAPISERIFENTVTASSPALLADHKVHGIVVVPCANLIETVLAAGARLGKEHWAIDELALHEPLVLNDKVQRTLQTIVAPEGAERASFRIVARNEGESPDLESAWTTHATGSLRRDVSAVANGRPFDPADALERIAARPFADDWRERAMHKADLGLGSSFRWIETHWAGNGEALARMRAPRPDDHADQYHIQPGLLECCIQLLETAPADAAAVMGAHVLACAGSIHVQGAVGAASWAHAVCKASDEDGIVGDVHLYDEIGRTLLEMKDVRLRRIPRDWLVRSAAGAPPDWVYELAWPEAPLEAASARAAGGRWLIVADRGGIAARLARRLELAGASCRLIEANEPNARKAVADWASAGAGGSLEGVIYAGALDLDVFTGADAIEPRALGQASCGGVLDVLHGLTETTAAKQPRLWLLTRGAQPIAAGPMAIAQSPLWGLARVIAVEFPELNCSCVDLDTQASGADAGLVFQEVWSGNRETQVGYRGDKRYAARLRRLAASPGAKPFRVRKDGAYLITGGLGGLGLKLAQWLVNRGARRLVLTGRRGPSEDAAAQLRELEADGAHILVVQADVAQRAHAVRLFEQIDAQAWELAGVFHAAGVLDDGILRQQTLERFVTVMAPKVEGAWNLHELTRQRPLEHFVMFSSAAALVGSPGQGNYAAANAFLDGLAHHRRSLGLPALAIDWGGWAEVGMAAELDRRQGKARDAAGVGRIDPVHGLATLERLLGQDLAQAGVLPIDWAEFFEQFPAGLEPAWLAEFTGQRSAKRESDGPPELVKQLETVPEPERRPAVLAYVQKKAAQVLRSSSERLPDPRRSLNELGVDSLMGVELCNALGRGVGQRLAPTILFSHPNLAALADHLADDVLGLPRADKKTEAPVADELRERALAEVEQLSEEEINALLSLTPAQNGVEERVGAPSPS